MTSIVPVVLNVCPVNPDCAIFRPKSVRIDLRTFIGAQAMTAMATLFSWVMRVEMGVEDDDAIELIVRLDYPWHWMNMDPAQASDRRAALPDRFHAMHPPRAALVAARYCSREGAIFTDAPQRFTGLAAGNRRPGSVPA
ncbi:MAG TPA: hypothetical protein VFM11_13615 [Burkholderiales bacterium]|nr:hypothetical protein [Burkholderiales bacterium]